MRKLLNIDANAKTVKGQAQGYMTAVLYLAPYKSAGLANICPMAETAGCVSGCLNTAGRGGMSKGNVTRADNGLPDNTIQAARIAKTRALYANQSAFIARLAKEIKAFIAKAQRKGLIPVVRLNGTSDLRWESMPHGQYANLFEAFPDVQFYDYTKIPNRKVQGIANYHLSYSYSARPDYQKYVGQVMENQPATNIVIVFRSKDLPSTFLGREVINGDETDLRFTDKAGVVVGLYAKGRARKDTSGFVVG